jgi:hypothetical protein
MEETVASDYINGLIGSFQRHRVTFEAFCRSLSEEELARPVPGSSWIVKDFISHLGTLDVLFTEQFAALRAGLMQELGDSDGSKPFDIDAWNEPKVQERRAWPLERILAEAAENRAAFLEALATLEDQDVEQIMHFTGDNKRDPADLPFKVFLSGVSRHDPIHVADMLKALPERAADPVIQAWLNDPVVQWYQAAMAGPPRR